MFLYVMQVVITFEEGNQVLIVVHHVFLIVVVLIMESFDAAFDHLVDAGTP